MLTMNRTQLSGQRSRVLAQIQALDFLQIEIEEKTQLEGIYSGIIKKIDTQLSLIPETIKTPEKLHTVLIFDDPATIHKFIFEKADKAANPKKFPNLDAFYNNSNYLDCYTDLITITNIERQYLENKLYSDFFKAIVTSNKISKGKELIHTIPMIIGIETGIKLPEFITDFCNVIHESEL